MHYEYIIIGSGLGGLQCAYRLTKQGHKVLVLEKEPQPGGCLQTFRRASVEFDGHVGEDYPGAYAVVKSVRRVPTAMIRSACCVILLGA